MAHPDVRECVVCAWREGCRLKWRNEPGGALHCPEFTFDLRLARGGGPSAAEAKDTHRTKADS